MSNQKLDRNTNPTGSIPQPEKDSQGKIKGEFYPLQRAELMELHKRGIINNAGYVHLALRYENPFCNRPIEVIPKEFSTRWEMPENSVYKAVALLAEEGVLSIKRGKLVVQWIEPDLPPHEPTKPEKEQAPQLLVNQGLSQEDHLIDSQYSALFRNSKNFCESENKFSDPQKDFQIRKNQEPDSTYTAKSQSLRSLKNVLDPLDANGGQKKSVENQEVNNEVIKPISKEVEPRKTEQVPSQQKHIHPKIDISKGQNFGRDCDDLQQVLDNHGILGKVESLITEMKTQGIEATSKVIAAIKECHISQLMFALNHVANTREDISNPSSVFVYQAYRAQIEHLGPREPIVSAEAMGYWNTPVEEAVNNLARLKAMLKGKRKQQ